MWKFSGSFRLRTSAACKTPAASLSKRAMTRFPIPIPARETDPVPSIARHARGRAGCGFAASEDLPRPIRRTHGSHVAGMSAASSGPQGNDRDAATHLAPGPPNHGFLMITMASRLARNAAPTWLWPRHGRSFAVLSNDHPSARHFMIFALQTVIQRVAPTRQDPSLCASLHPLALRFVQEPDFENP